MRTTDLALVTLERSDAPSAAASVGAAGLSPVELVLGASPVVQLVMLMLAAMSVICWFIIGAKWLSFQRATAHSRRFLEAFWTQTETHQGDVQGLERLYTDQRSFAASPIARVFQSGFREFVALVRGDGSRSGGQRSWPPPQVGTQGLDLPRLRRGLAGVERALRRSSNFELTRLETRLSFLATTGSIAPFVGLFGTVWGIMNSFIAIQGERSAGLDVVAPGIAEALIATAIGLAAAIPAVMAYNYFVRRLRVLESEMDNFAQSYMNIVDRYLS